MVERGLQLELFGVVPDADIFRDDIGRRIMNGLPGSDENTPLE